METKYKIEKGIPVPARYESMTKYPIRDLAVGDCFFFPKENRQRVISAARSYGRRNNKKFTIRKYDKERCGCWRTM